MGTIKSLAKDTAVYGLSSIVGRFLNWCLVPLYTIVFPPEQYGEVTYIYAVVAVLMILLTYGMESGFFRFANHHRWTDPMQVYSTALISLAVSGTVFFLGVMAMLPQLAVWMKCPGRPSFVWLMALTTAVDAFSALPFGYLRFRGRSVRFAMLKLVNIGLNIGLNLFFILLCPWLAEHAPGTVSWFYDPSFGIGYIFLANTIATLVTLLMLIPELRGFRWRFCAPLWREMLSYSWPLLVLGVAGIMNQSIDKILLPALYRGGNPMDALGIYGANYKIAIVLVMFLQAFRFAYEPVIFAQHKSGGSDSLQKYGLVMKYFVVVGLFIFLGVMFYLDILRYFISPKYFSGLQVVPLVMLGELCFGVFFNLSVWYKVTDRTGWGATFSLMGLAVTVGLNVLLVPRYGYMGCAWAAFGCYLTMMLASYFVGQAKYPIPYPLGRIGLYTLTAAGLYVLGLYVAVTPWAVANYLIRALLLAVFAALVARKEHISPSDIIKPILSKLHR